MDHQEPQREVFRRSGLITLPDWTAAVAVALAVGLAARRFGLARSWEGLLLMGLPLLWAGARTVQWLCHTWTVTADGRLVTRRGALFVARQAFPLVSVSDIGIGSPAGLRGLDIGHVSFEVTAEDGQRIRLGWTCVAGHRRLCEIIRARGQLPIGRPARQQTPRRRAGEWLRALRLRLARPAGWADLKDFGRFMAFCRRVLSAAQGGPWPPAGIPSTTVECWMAVLRRARVVVGAPGAPGARDWRVAGDIGGLGDICRRLGPGELRRAVEEPARRRGNLRRAA